MTAGPSTDPALPPQQQRLLAQLRAAMTQLNSKHGSATTCEILNQIVQSVAAEDEGKAGGSFKPEYSDVVVDTELAAPPPPPVERAAKPVVALQAVPNWFSFDEISEMERVHFGPLFSMEEERWKMYLSMRNDVVRIYEDLIAPLPASGKGELFLTSSDLRTRLHPKDDAAWVFELWKFLTAAGVINRGRKDAGILATASGCGIALGGEKPVPSSRPKSVNFAAYTPILCSTCGRECRFVCYKPLPPPPQSPEAMAEGDETSETVTPLAVVKDEPMAEADDPVYMCHDCTPAFFEKIPLRLFVDQELADKVARGEFEEVTKDDLKHFLIHTSEVKESHDQTKSNELLSVANKLIAKISGGKRKNSVVAKWDAYGGVADSRIHGSGVANPLEILDQSMQEALTGAGQKIRGSVLIEQQVRNMVYSGLGNNEEIPPTCPTSVDRAAYMLNLLLTRVGAALDSPLPHNVVSSPLMEKAKKTDPVHFELLALVVRLATAGGQLKQELLSTLNVARIQELISERVQVKSEFIRYLKSVDAQPVPKPAVSHAGTAGSAVFAPVKVDASVKLASQNPQQLRLISL